jgi:putative spermidine/putrescine transport system permease protein
LRDRRRSCAVGETNLDVRTAAASGLIVIATLILMLLAEKFAGLTRQMR